MIHYAYEEGNIQKIQVIADVFEPSVIAFFNSMEQLPSAIRFSSSYLVAHSGAMLLKDSFLHHMRSTLSQTSGVPPQEQVRMACHVLEVMLVSIRSLLDAVDEEATITKALPEFTGSEIYSSGTS